MERNANHFFVFFLGFRSFFHFDHRNSGFDDLLGKHPKVPTAKYRF